jgi:hypothetical protein
VSLFAPVVDPRASKDWYKFREADAAQAKTESAKVVEYYEQKDRERKAREQQENKRS